MPQYLPMMTSTIAAGFPSPADDFQEDILSLNELMIKNKQSTFLVRVSGDSMIGAGIFPNDILVVDRSLTVKHNAIIIAIVENEFTVKRLKKLNQQWYLVAENPDYKAIPVDNTITCWGVVTFTIHQHE